MNIWKTPGGRTPERQTPGGRIAEGRRPGRKTPGEFGNFTFEILTFFFLVSIAYKKFLLPPITSGSGSPSVTTFVSLQC